MSDLIVVEKKNQDFLCRLKVEGRTELEADSGIGEVGRPKSPSSMHYISSFMP